MRESDTNFEIGDVVVVRTGYTYAPDVEIYTGYVTAINPAGALRVESDIYKTAMYDPQQFRIHKCNRVPDANLRIALKEFAWCANWELHLNRYNADASPELRESFKNYHLAVIQDCANVLPDWGDLLKTR